MTAFNTITARDWRVSIQRARAQRNEIAEQIKLHMSTNNESSDGGPAFPRPVSHSVEGGTHRGCLGMSLRDWFAGQALAAIIERNEIADQSCLLNDDEPMPEDTRAGWDEVDSWEKVAAATYAVADAMLAAREAKQ